MTKKKIEIDLTEEEKAALEQAQQENDNVDQAVDTAEELDAEVEDASDFHSEFGEEEPEVGATEKKGIFSKLKDKISPGESSDEVLKLQEANAELKDKNLRLLAEFENFRRRTAKERIEYLKTAGSDTLVSLLPVMDDFERAFKASENEEEARNSGFGLIYQKMVKSFEQMGMEKMEVMHEPFDADFHEAIAELPAPSEELKGKVLDVVENGYVMNEKIIRFAKVVVGK